MRLSLSSARLLGALCAVALVGGCAEKSPDVSAAHVDRQAEVERSQQFYAQLGECLTERGFPAQVQPDGALKVDHGGQADQLAEVESTCTEQLGGQPTAAVPGEVELGMFYDVQVEAYECLTEHGLNPMPPSTREEFVATYLTGESWYAHQPLTPGGSPMPTAQCPLPQLTDIDW